MFVDLDRTPRSVQHDGLEMGDLQKTTERKRDEGDRDTKQRGRLYTVINPREKRRIAGEGIDMVVLAYLC